MATVFVTREIPESGLEKLRQAGHDVVVSEKDGVLTKSEFLASLAAHNPDAIISLLTDTIDADVLEAAPRVQIIANYAVGYNNISVEDAKAREIIVTNTPGVLTDTVAEHTIALMLAITSRIPEADRYTRTGEYKGWAPMLFLGTDLKGKTLGVLGAGRIGSRVAEIASKGLGMNIIYHDVKENEFLNSELHAQRKEAVEDVLRESDVVTVHVPLLDSTRHLLDEAMIRLMKPSAYLINSSRGPVIDEAALVAALQNREIKGAALDVFEHEPEMTPGLADLENVVITPHIASATEETRGKMSDMVAANVIAALAGNTPPNQV
tara:strand:+ start:5536 stop:6501 length:966 start_codon:yes stop_codon:yes gene_type:complete